MLVFTLINFVSLFLAPAPSEAALSNHYLHQKNPGAKIVGGVNASRNEFPYQLSLRKNGRHICGAVLVFPDKAVTGARCVETGSLQDFTLVAGDHSLREPDNTEQERSLSMITINPTFDSWTLENDIAVLKVSPPFVSNSAVQQISMPLPGQPASGPATVTGWGVYDAEEGYMTDILLKGQLNVISNADCKIAYGGSADVPNTSICAGTVAGVPDACTGDNGGPLVCANGGSPYLCGIFSWGNSLCNQTGLPGVYTDVSYFVDWVANL